MKKVLYLSIITLICPVSPSLMACVEASPPQQTDLTFPSEITRITACEDLVRFRGQIVIYVTLNPNMRAEPDSAVQFAVVTNGPFSNQSPFATDIFPLVPSGLQNLKFFDVNGHMDENPLYMRRANCHDLSYVNRKLLEGHIFSCDLFEFEQTQRMTSLQDALR